MALPAWYAQDVASKKSLPATPAPIPRRETLEVEASWLDPSASDPPPPRRDTLEVQADWLESEEAAAHDRLRRASTKPMPRVSKTDVLGVASPKTLPPLPSQSSPAGSAQGRKRPRQPWEPPTLPPPPATAARVRKVIPPPLPREEEDAPVHEGRSAPKPGGPRRK
jgi:hypothetical protein